MCYNKSMTKTCSKCKKEKDVSAFSKRGEGYQPWCKVCAHESRAQWSRDNKDRTRHHRLIYRHRITSEQFEQMLANQENKCKICDKEFESVKEMKVDHDHACCSGPRGCGKCVRSILCNTCNVQLAPIENKEFLEKALAYLESYTIKERI